MVNPKHFNDLFNLIDIINKNNINGSIVETGVWKGGCIMLMMLKQKEYNQDRLFYLFDTYEGLPPPSDNDSIKAHTLFNLINKEPELINGDPNLADGLQKNHKKYDKFKDIPGISNNGKKNKWCYCSLDNVKKNIYSINYNKNNTLFIKGDIMKTLDNNINIPEAISILRIDTDWHDSVKKSLEILYPYVSSGGFIIIDDYYDWQGAKNATDNFFKNKKYTIFEKGGKGRRYIIQKI